MSDHALPVQVDLDINGGVAIYATERAAALHCVMDVAAQVSPVVIGNVGRALHEYQESMGQSEASALDLALMDVPQPLALTVLKLTGEEAVALAAALNYFGLKAIGGEGA